MDNTSHRARGRRRRENVDGGRQHSHRVLVSPEEEAVLARMAAERRITVPRLMMEATLSRDDHEAPVERRRVIEELFASRREAGEVALGLRALIQSGVVADGATVAAAEQVIERSREAAEALGAAAQGLAA